MKLGELKNPVILIPLLLSTFVAILIILLAARVTDFSKNVTDYYAPAIYAVKNFVKATDHVKVSLEESEVLDEVILHHLIEANEELQKLSSGNLHPAYKEHIDEMTLRTEDFIEGLRSRTVPRERLVQDIRQLDEEAKSHVYTHENDLENARTGIKNSVSKIRSAALVLLFLGIMFSVREVQIHKLREREKEKLSAIKAFVSALDARDPYTKGHSERVANYAMSIAEEIGLKKELREPLYLAALMHDIGKIAVPDAVLNKTGKLNESEWEKMREHPAMTAQILNNIDSLTNIMPWALYHHERFDGKGYPDAKSGEEIPLPAQIIAIADAFDAMTSARPYRAAMQIDEALAEIENNRGIQWRPDVVDAFLRSCCVVSKADLIKTKELYEII